jgi:hypothetical protein
MKDRLIRARNWSEQLADSAFEFRYFLMLTRIGKRCADDLKPLLVQFDQVFDAWKAEMDGGICDALEIASTGLFDGMDSIARDYILELVVAIRSSIVCLFPEELLSNIDATVEAPASVSWLWSIAEKHNVASPKLIAEGLKAACKIAGDKEKRKRMRSEFNAAIRGEAQANTIAAPKAVKKNASAILMEIALDRPEAMAWSLREWMRETGIKKTTINSCKAYKSQLLKRARECRKAIGVQEFQKDARLLDGEKRMN